MLMKKLIQFTIEIITNSIITEGVDIEEEEEEGEEEGEGEEDIKLSVSVESISNYK
jgi:hypothetical protein